jgi:LacI family transcriptional regulator
LSHVVSPALTTIWRPFGDMARIATQQLIDRIEGQAVTAELPPPLRLVEAESSGPAPA